jgi:ribosomal protein S18 acetylase RimI-like enzyme
MIKMTFWIKSEFSDSISGVSEFMKREWVSSNLENFGRNINESEWNQPLTIVAYEGKKEDNSEIVGVAKCTIAGKTLRLSHLLIKTEYRAKKGIGTKMIKELEKYCHENKYHKIRLSTSEKHRNIAFYEKNGFSVEAILENDAFGMKWFILSKFLKIK